MPVAGDGLWARLAHTPLRDALRGRVTAQLDVRRAIAAAGLPDELAALVWQTTRRTRLWRSEKVDVAAELAGHFRDGLAAGRPAADLARDFGDPRAAARLIRRAKLRGRAWPMRALRRGMQGCGLVMALLVAGYAALTVRYLLAAPRPSRDYIAELNAAPLAMHSEERAWPLYRAALMAYEKPAAELDPEVWNSDTVPVAGNAGWSDLLEFVEQNREPLRLTRAGAARRRLGYVFGDAHDSVWLQRIIGRDSVIPEGGHGPLWHLLLPHIQELAKLRLLLAADARRALVTGDRAAWLADVRAVLALAEQLRDPPSFLVIELHSLATFEAALAAISETLATRPELLTDDDLRELQTMITSYAGGGQLRLRLTGERMLLDDLWQHIYTDDGDGDGHLTANGLWTLIELAPMTPGELRGNVRDYDERLLIGMLGPAMTVAVAGRQEMADLSHRLLNELERERQGPMWTWTASAVDDQLRSWHGSHTERFRYLPLLLMLPGVQGVATAGELGTQRRDAVLVAIALVQFRRRTGDWPKTLEELTPALLPAVPADRFTGQPLPYRLVDGRPLLYSYGVDRTDQHGQPGANSDPPQWLPADAPNLLHYGGDWPLWPPAKQAK
jgi:hypothetical protein